jgi:hypothetical protein
MLCVVLVRCSGVVCCVSYWCVVVVNVVCYIGALKWCCMLCVVLVCCGGVVVCRVLYWCHIGALNTEFFL